jgi:hypothetical protein
MLTLTIYIYVCFSSCQCDGKHPTDNCPYYKKARERHPDAQKGSKRLGGSSKLPGATLRGGRVARQPGDGSCLFHSLSFGLRDGSSAASLRRQVGCRACSVEPLLNQLGCMLIGLYYYCALTLH